MLRAKQKGLESAKTRVLIVDNEPMLRERLSQVIAQEPGFVVCGETDNARHALNLIPATRPDLAIADLSLKDSHGLELVKDIHLRHPRLRVLIFSMGDELLCAERAIRAGASGYVSKEEVATQVLRAIRTVLSGEIYISEKVNARTIRQFFATSPVVPSCPLDRLSDREFEVFQLIGQGHSSSQIAIALCLDIKTIETYRSRIKEKLKLNNSTQLAQQAALCTQTASINGRARLSA